MKTPALLFLTFSISLIASWAEPIIHPNVILFMADDMGMGDTSAYQDFTGNADEVQLATPNLERLARMGVRFTDAHTPASRCTTTRYALLTGRYAWRGRMKHWVLFGAQGDPLIERDRPTLATLFRDAGYGTAMVGKWHVGLRYTQSDGRPAAGWEDADLTKPLFDGPLDHGFEYARFTSRSHGTSGPDAGESGGKKKKKSGPNQEVGPGHIHGRQIVGATGNGKELVKEGPNAYVLSKLGSRHSDHAIEYLDTHLAGGGNEKKPFFLYYPSNSNHSPYTPTDEIGGIPVRGASRTKSGQPMDDRHDFIYENDVAVGRLLDYLEANDDPRHPGKKLIETTLVIFTSDNGAEIDSDVATGPFRSHKGSCFEGGHRVPFIVSWGAGRIGDGDSNSPGASSGKLIALSDLFATFSALIHMPYPDGKGAEDSVNVLSAWQTEEIEELSSGSGEYYIDSGRPLFFHFHKESKEDPAVAAMRVNNPQVGDKVFEGQWKIFFDARLIRLGSAHPFALYDLANDRYEETNRLEETPLKPLVEHLVALAEELRNAGGHRLVTDRALPPITFRWGDDKWLPRSDRDYHPPFHDQVVPAEFSTPEEDLTLRISAVGCLPLTKFHENPNGLGIDGGKILQVDGNDTLDIRFDRDVIIESVGLVAGNGICGGAYGVGTLPSIPIYCLDGDIDAKDQSGLLSDLGVLPAGKALTLTALPHLGVEQAGRWRLKSITVRPLKKLETSF
ncbi:MAG: sulfatase-like hydrolase/transferase [Verrucomicrobiae bacterium]|nr:sulfatase-like hydrolase/transferase [Verrucomicrobiae bacterium]